MTDRPIRLLHVDDDPAFAEMVSVFLEQECSACHVTTATDVPAGLEQLRSGAFDCVVSDYEMPGQTGLDLLRAVRDSHPDLPFVLFTGRGSEEIAAEAISAGVSDYLQKGGGTEQYTVLANRIENLVSQYRAQRDLRQRVDAIETAREGIGLLDDDGRVVYANRAFEETFGYEEGELVDVSVTALVDDDDAERLRAALAGDGWTGEVLMRHRDGTGLLADIAVSRTAGGERVFTVQDISAAERREHELFVKNRAMEAAPIGIIVTDPALPDNGIVYANREFERLTGYAESEILGENCRFLQGEETAPETVTEMREAIAAEEPVTVELRNYRKDGTPFWNRVWISPLRNADGAVTNFVGFQDDVTERVEARREQAAMFDRVSDAFFALDRGWCFTYLNAQAERVLDRTADELLGESVWEAFPGAVDSTFEAEYQRAMESQETVSFEEYYPPLGTWFEVRAYPSETGLSVYFRDVSERKANERRLEERTRQFETFGDILAHDLETPLVTLEGRLELAAETGDTTHVVAARESLDRVRTLVDDLATVMREGSVVSDVRDVDLAEVARTLWTSIDTAEATLQVEAVGPIRADERALTRLLQNLFRNSVEHGSTSNRPARQSGDTVEHGSTSSRSQAHEDSVEHGSMGSRPEADDSVEHGGPTVAVTVGPLDDGAGFYVADDGSGIPDAERERVFEPGYTTKSDGTGFGMVSVRRIALAHGWELSIVDSEAGGARFEIRGVERPADG
ncbi:PAS domain S-box protein [Salinigranum marinum]|uniref:PAS domain S-box protein n=1 Tax=Salinigranum marinum TaxID=1515595 RepID=UPI002989C409|nr:PAS domain S-box protein [Salinigranum marinum]